MTTLTRSGWGVAVTGAVALVAGWLFGLPELVVVGAAVGVLVTMAVARTTITALRLEVVRHLHPERVHAGSTSRVDLTVRNRGRRRTPVLTLRDQVTDTAGAELLLAPLEPGARVRASYRLPTRRRGLVTVGPLDVELGDPFGLTRVTTPAAPPSTLVVYPAVDRIAPASRSDGADPQGGRSPGLATDGDEFHSLRPYVLGDDLRRVHWPTTARRDELSVRQHERHQQGRTTVLLDVRRAVHTDESFERAVSAAASLLVAAEARGDEIRLVTTAGAGAGYRSGRAALAASLEHLASVVLVADGPTVRVDHPGTLVAVTTPPGAVDLRPAAGPGRRFLVVFERRADDPGDRTDGRRGTVHVGADQDFADVWAMGERTWSRSGRP